MELTTLQPEVESLTVQAAKILIIDSDTYTMAGGLWDTIKAMRAKIAETFDPIIDKAHKAHKEAVSQKKKLDEPLEYEQRQLKGRMIGYDQEQIAIARKKQLEQEAIERKRAEEEALETASLMEKAGLKEEAAAVLDAPIEMAPVVVKKETPKVEGFSYRSNWKAQCTDLKALVQAVAEGKVPFQALEANTVFLGQQARSLKEAMSYPGVKVWEEKV